jgi:hypothetical protein
VSFAEEDTVRLLDSLDKLNALLVWVDPIIDGRDRSILDDMLRDVAKRGTLVFTHPDTILKMGTKDILYDTRALSWSLDTDRYETLDAFVERFPSKLAVGSPRVLKQHRGNGGIGVWKVEPLQTATGGADIRIQHAAPRHGTTEDLTIGEFVGRMTQYFGDGGHLIDQAFATRVSEGMVRAYLVRGNRCRLCAPIRRSRRCRATSRSR